MTELFWRISAESQAKLMQYQDKHHKDKPTLDMAGRRAPWQQDIPSPVIPVRTDMDEEELDKFMRSKPKGGRRG